MEEKNTSEQNNQLMQKIDKLQHEVFYNRVAMAVFFIISLLYINLKTGNIANALGTFIEMFMP